MENNILKKINNISRYTLGFVFFYHGLVPKILWISPVEFSLTSAHNLDPNIFSPIAGVCEIILALLIVFYKKSLLPIYAAIIAMVALLLDVAFIQPKLLFEAFNPVTINIVCIILGYFVVLTHNNKSV